jgi:hypothetical protein
VKQVLAKRLKDIIFTNCGSWCGKISVNGCKNMT